MIQKISKESFIGHGPISILYPGKVLSDSDTGIGSIGRIDHAFVKGNMFIAMHPHVNDEILSYFRTGKVEHIDSEGIKETITKNKLMLMKAGRMFQHEERIVDAGEPMEGLQIFVRPGKKDMKPHVVFFDLDSHHSKNVWRLLASPTSATKFQFSSETWLYDMKLSKGLSTSMPSIPKNTTSLLYVFNGHATVNGKIDLNKREGIIFKHEKVSINTTEGAELVLFVTDEQAEIYKDGMFSGNQAKNISH